MTIVFNDHNENIIVDITIITQQLAVIRYGDCDVINQLRNNYINTIKELC